MVVALNELSDPGTIESPSQEGETNVKRQLDSCRAAVPWALRRKPRRRFVEFAMCDHYRLAPGGTRASTASAAIETIRNVP